MKKIIELENGAKLEVRDDGYSFFSSKGKRVDFDAFGEIESPSWLQYFDFIGSDERELVKLWVTQQIPENKVEKMFLDDVKMCLQNINYDFRIATIEPSMDEVGRLYYKEGAKVIKDLRLKEWAKKTISFAPQYESGIAELYELFLWYALRSAKGYWTLSYICSMFNMPTDYPNTSEESYELSGAREIGGFKDGIGNTYRIVKVKSKYVICGDAFNGSYTLAPITNVSEPLPNEFYNYYVFGSAIAVMVLRK